MNGQQRYKQAKSLIPGGTQLLSKRPEMFLPEQWPCYYDRANGVTVVDLDGRTYIDMGIMGVGAAILGYADPDVDEAVKGAVERGVMCTLNVPEEVELAELLCELHPWAEKVRYARSGGEAMAMAVRIARAHTRRDRIAFCGYHGWADWYLAANIGETDALDGHLMPGLDAAGVPRSLGGTVLPFHYNRLDQLKAIASEHRGELAAVVMEPQRSHPPEPGFLEGVRELSADLGAVLVFDEITTGFRMASGGIHMTLNVQPDMAVFAKGMANGYAMSAVVGTGRVMDAAQSTFLSSTNWTERIGPTAALATIQKHRRVDAATHLAMVGERVKQGWEQAAADTGLSIKVGGLPSLAEFDICEQNDDILLTLFVQEMLQRGYLAFNQFKPSYAHTTDHADNYTVAVREAFAVLRDAIDRGDASERLNGPVARRGFYRLA